MPRFSDARAQLHEMDACPDQRLSCLAKLIFIPYFLTKRFRPRPTVFCTDVLYLRPLLSFLPLHCVMVLQVVFFLWCSRRPGVSNVARMSIFPPFGLH